MKRERQHGDNARQPVQAGAPQNLVDRHERQRAESERRCAQNEKRFTEQASPQRPPKHQRSQADRREWCEMEVTGAREVPCRDREIPIVEGGKFATGLDERDGCRPHGEHNRDIEPIAVAGHTGSLQSNQADEYRRPPACHPPGPIAGRRRAASRSWWRCRI